MLHNLKTYLQHDIWQIRLKGLPRFKSLLIRNVRIFLLSVRGFLEDKCPLRSSGLTLYTLLSIVPMLALVFGISKGFGMQQKLETEILENLPAQEEVLIEIVHFAKSTLESAQGGILAGVGIAFLVWLIIKVLWSIELSFNGIWGVKKNRPLGRKLTDYTALIILCPIFILASSSITVFVTAQLEIITQKMEFLEFFSPLLFSSLRLMPYVLIWALFTFVYIFMPNTKVKLSSGLLGGIVAGTVYVITQWAYFSFQVGVAKYNAIYGSFAAFPLFVIWLQISWLIVLFGAEISFAHQNVETYEFEPDCQNLSHHSRRLLSLYIMHHIINRFSNKMDHANTSVSSISHKLEIPVRLVREILYQLEECELITETFKQEDNSNVYLPAKDLTEITVEEFIEKLENLGSNRIPVKHTTYFKKISETLENFKFNITHSNKNVRIKDIA